MLIDERLRQFRKAKKLSQGDIEARTGLLRCYISRVENGHTVPSIETLEKFARALEVPMYQLFYDGEAVADEKKPLFNQRLDWASQGRGLRLFTKLTRLLAHLSQGDRDILLLVAGQVAAKRHRA